MPTSHISNEQEYEKFKAKLIVFQHEFNKFLENDCPPVAKAKLEGIVKGLILCSVEMASYRVQEGKGH